MERSEWLSLELTRELLRFIEKDRLTAVKNISSIPNPENSDETQFNVGQLVGMNTAYDAVIEHMKGADDEPEEENIEGEEYES